MTGKLISFKSYANKFFSEVNALQCFQRGDRIDLQLGFDKTLDALELVRSESRNVFFVGNGASSTIASHAAVDFWKTLKIKSHVFNEASSLTAVANDISFSSSFSEPLSLYAEDGDVLFAISSSGQSENILKSLETANCSGLTTIALTGMNQHNTANSIADFAFYHSGQTYGSVESCHALLLHYFIDNLGFLNKKG